MQKTELGKITKVKLGHCGYQECGFGVSFLLEGEGWGVCSEEWAWDPNKIDCKDSSDWTEKNRNEEMSKIMRFISALLKEAKVDDLNKLHDVPVEVTFENRVLKSWRILTEVL